MKQTKVLLATLFSTFAISMPVLAVDYDLVISNGWVMDPETLFDAIANVGIKNGRIAEISKKPLKGAKTVDAILRRGEALHFA